MNELRRQEKVQSGRGPRATNASLSGAGRTKAGNGIRLRGVIWERVIVGLFIARASARLSVESTNDRRPILVRSRFLACAHYAVDRTRPDFTACALDDHDRSSRHVLSRPTLAHSPCRR
jgi:hypothetical protein